MISVGPDTLLWAWLPDYLQPFIGLPDEESSIGERLSALSISEYARESAQFDCGVVDRLCLLAIYIQEEVQPFRQFLVWRAADRVYQEAIKRDPGDATVLTSRALTAFRMNTTRPDQEAVMMAIARDESLRATLIGPSWHAFSVAAECHYGTDTETSLACAESALHLRPAAPWPSLWRAHCLHDLERYEDAAEAYRAVPKDDFQGPKAWRMDLLVEQRASCLWKSGQIDEAHTEFDRILTRYEAQPHLAESGLNYLQAAVPQWPEFQDRIDAVKAAANY